MGKAKSWNREIDFQCRFGVWPFQKTLDISAKGFTWCGELIPLKGITRLRWGVELTRGGVFPKRQYIAVFGTDAKEYVIKTKQKDFYEHLVERYWKAVGLRLLTEMLDGLGEGRSYGFGPVTVEDGGVTVNKKGLLSTEQHFYKWNELGYGITNGNLCLAAEENPEQPLAALSFIWDDNTHVLFAALKLLEKSSDKTRMSRARISY